jgi:DNA-binding transcriptional LysR family regulator
MDRFKALNTFVEIVNSGGFAKAAKQLAVSRSVVSKQLQQLEAHLGVRLFQRTTRQFSLTEIGEQYYAFSRKILAEMEDEDANVSQLQKQPRGTLRIATSSSFGIFRLARIIADFMVAYPQIRVFCVFNNEFRFRPLGLVDSGLDVAICVSPYIEDSSVIARKIGTAEWAICASPKYLAQHGTPRTPKDLVRHNCLLLVRGGGGALWELDGPDGKTPINVSGSLISTVAAVREAALAGAGIAYLPRYSIEDDLARRRLRRVLPRFSTETRTIYALYPHRDWLPGKVRVFIEYLAARLGEPA